MEDEPSPPNRVVDFFVNKTILITGATGFLGRVLIEKLLRNCTSLEKIYVIIRDKRDKDGQQRLREMFNEVLFERLKREQGADVLDKVEAISGEMSAPDLGLSSRDRKKLTEETQIVYHAAATLKFDDPLKDTILLNVRGTKLMLELAKDCKRLEVFCHVSTAFCHEDHEVLTEEFYPSANIHRFLQICDWLDKSAIDTISKRLRGPHVNNYTFSKALAEGLIEEQKDELPVIIQRPSVVTPAWNEPFPGWTSNLNGPVGLLVGAGKGVIRTMYARTDTLIDCIPVDIVINGMITSVYDFCTTRSRRIYNLTSSELCPITTKQIMDHGLAIVNETVAFSQVLWYPNGSITQSRIAHCTAFVLFQLLPALFLDGFLCLIGYKPFMLRVQRKVWKGYQMFEYYANRKWNFRNDNIQTVTKQLNSSETKMFKYDADGFDLHEYLVAGMKACRRYVLKEPDEDMEAALKRMKMLRYLDLFCKAAFFVGLLYYIFNRFIRRM